MLALIFGNENKNLELPPVEVEGQPEKSWPDQISKLGFSGLIWNITPPRYLQDDEAWQNFAQVLHRAGELGLRVWIYDEDGYPSGAAGGLVLRQHPEYEAAGLVRLIDDAPAGLLQLAPTLGFMYAVAAYAHLNGQQVDLTGQFDDTGALCWLAPAPCRIERYVCRRAFEGTHASCNVWANRRYINVLEPEAVRVFLETTHRQYIERLGPEMVGVDAFFTDEPSFMTTYHPPIAPMYNTPDQVSDELDTRMPKLPMLPWWRGLPKAFEETCHYDLLPNLALMFEDQGASLLNRRFVRQDFYELLSNQYAAAFFGQMQSYLDLHGKALTGHVLHEERLYHHVGSEGSAMHALAPMRIPGCDILCGQAEVIVNGPRLLTPKYASSVAHVHDRLEVMCETSDWESWTRGECASLLERWGAVSLQVALGVTTFANYFDWPAFSVVEVQQFNRAVSRLCAVARQGRHVAGIGLLYPIRQVWSGFLPTSHWVSPDRQPPWLAALEQTQYQVARAILGSQLDFDFVDEEALLNGEITPSAWMIAQEHYRVLVFLPGTILPELVAQKVKRFMDLGGMVIAFHPAPVVRLGAGGHAEELPLSGLPQVYSSDDTTWLADLLEIVPPEIRLVPSTDRVFVRHTKLESGDIYLVVNTSAVPYEGEVHFHQGAGQREAWDPWLGHKVNTAPFILEGYGTRVILSNPKFATP